MKPSPQIISFTISTLALIFIIASTLSIQGSNGLVEVWLNPYNRSINLLTYATPYQNSTQINQNSWLAINSQPSISTGYGYLPGNFLMYPGRYMAIATFASNIEILSINEFNTKNFNTATSSRSPANITKDNKLEDVFLRDIWTGEIVYVSRNYSSNSNVIYQSKTGSSENPVVTVDGSVIAYESYAVDLVPNDLNNVKDIFVFDRSTSITTRANLPDLVNPSAVTTIEQQAIGGDSSNPSVCHDGSFIAFQSQAKNLVVPPVSTTFPYYNIYVRDVANMRTYRVSVGANSTSSSVQETDGNSINPTISQDCNYVVFESLATNLVNGDNNAASDVFRYNIQTKTLELISSTYKSGSNSTANGESYGAAVSADGQVVAFTSVASDIVNPALEKSKPNAGTLYIFMRNMSSVGGFVRRVSIDHHTWNQPNGNSQFAALDNSGRFVSYSSQASNLISHTSNYFSAKARSYT